ncbi:MAG: DUF4296 domain-containing protein [Chitinophagaceae bacterium]|nr:DUF4296 domain-containing protein [Chitinophagaceae bacterium]
MMRTVIYGSLCLLISCNSTFVPKRILPVKEMQQVLWDVMQADELVNYYYTKDSSINRIKKSKELYQKIFRMHEITSEDFKRSLHYYQSRPDLLKIILDSLQHKTSAPSIPSRKPI